MFLYFLWPHSKKTLQLIVNIPVNGLKVVILYIKIKLYVLIIQCCELVFKEIKGGYPDYTMTMMINLRIILKLMITTLKPQEKPILRLKVTV